MEEKPDNEVWRNTVDGGRFTITVIREAPYKGRLSVVVTQSWEQILSTEVALAYDAPFGPDVDDLTLWKEYALAAIDAWLVDHNEPIPGTNHE